MAALEKVALADTINETQTEDDDSLSGLRDLETVDWKRTEIHCSGHLAMMEKAQEFFQICDREVKGFINRRDMQRLQAELPLCSDELQSVFDSLDTDGNGYLTLEEFITGFSLFLFGEKVIVDKVNKDQHQNQWDQRLVTVEDDDDDEEHHFCMLMDNLGARNLFKDQREIRNLWAQLRKDEPHLLTNFEDFLAKISLQIQEVNEEKKIMEFALKRKSAEYGEEIKHLYEEMEQQIKRETERVLHKDSEKFNSQSQELENMLRVKEQELEQLTQKQRRLEKRCRELQSEKQETRIENQKLKQINKELEKDLQKASDDLLFAEHHVQLLQEETSQLHGEREMELYRVTEGLEREKVGLCKQLDLLREMNKHLRDERNMTLSGFQKPSIPGASASWKQRSATVIDNYTETRLLSDRKDDDYEAPSNSKPFSENLGHANGHNHVRKETDKESVAKVRQRQYLQRIISIEEDPLPQFLEMHSTTHLNNWIEVEEEMETEEELVPERRRQEAEKVPSSPRRRPVGKEALTQDKESSASPDRLFKIIFVGNSSVGKSCVLRRFCGDSFHPGISATVGIDYHVKTINVDNSLLALQLWDTAGQERFRSITMQFFRKADGVVLIYDITAAVSFRAVRQWLESVQDGAGAEVVILLLANKTDLESERQVSSEEGQRLAKECNLIFYECSACSGINITESMVHLARLLKELEDKEKEKIVELGEESAQQKTCCAR
ncbi:EF-hand calcium-binding domain-containing protein 4B isoform X2 [Heptranchias perlo]|uniref:EF-hand calcium-binding domain-containing protein 4B isoform X2 n=1 Tax=Heptranchias perlo TaxID=212740 RepID=UPI003559C9DF